MNGSVLESAAWYVCVISIAAVCGVSAQVEDAFTPPGGNVALSTPYTLDPAPNCRHCTEEGDAVQLTDGKYAPPDAESSLWVLPACVGWQRRSPVYIDHDSATDGKHWLGIVEGVEDYEYLRMLRDRIEKAEADGQADARVAAARKLLDTVPDEVIAAVEEGDRAACDRGRLMVLDALVSLGR